MAGRVARRSLLDLAGGAAQAQPARPARLEEAGLAPYGGPPERLATHLADELRRHAGIVRRSGARLD